MLPFVPEHTKLVYLEVEEKNLPVLDANVYCYLTSA